MSHLRRPPVSRRTPVHVNLRFKRDVQRMRRFKAFTIMCNAIYAATNRYAGFRIIHFSLQRTHLHLIVEAEHESVLARGMQGLAVRLARRFNKLLGRTGTFFADRYHSRTVSTPLAVRRVLAYVLNNARKHKEAPHHRRGWVDPYSSAVWFDGFSEPISHSKERCPTSAPLCTLLKSSWRFHGLVDTWEVPGPDPQQRRVRYGPNRRSNWKGLVGGDSSLISAPGV